jgi:hypothetical protein
VSSAAVEEEFDLVVAVGGLRSATWKIATPGWADVDRASPRSPTGRRGGG